MIDHRHEDVLDDVEQDIWREKGADRDIETVSEFQHFSSS